MMRKHILCVALAVLIAATNVWGGVVKLAILSDVHVAPGNANEQMLRLAVEEINAGDAQAVLMTGDLTNEGSDVQLHHVKSILDGITKPLYVIPGNHENNWSQSACRTFTRLWGADRFVFSIDSLVVIGMNCGPYMKMGDGHLRQEDLLWLDSTLNASVKPGMKVLSINHYPILDDLDNYRAYVEVLRKYPVITHQCGHYHRWRLYETDGISGVVVRALDMGGGNYGYTLMSIDLDRMWMHVLDKPIGKPAQVMFEYPVNLNYFDSDTPPAYPEVENPLVTCRRLMADDASIFTRVTVDRDNVYFGNSLGYCKAVDKHTGALRWQHKTDGMLFSRPAVSGNLVVVPASDHRLLWLDRLSGRLLWSYRANGPYVADGVVSNGVLYQGGYKTFQAWDVKRHRLLWHYDSLANYCQAAPVVADDDVIFGAWDTRLRCLDRRSGKLRWQWDNGNKANLYSPGNVVPVVTDNKVVIVAPDRVTTALDRSTGQQIWREKNEHKVRESLGRSHDGTTAYAKTMDGTLVAMSTQGDHYQLLWSTDLGLGYEHAPCIVLEHDGYIYCGSRRGMLTIVDAATHRLIYSHALGTSEVNGFETDENGDVWCSLIEGTIWKISTNTRSK